MNDFTYPLPENSLRYTTIPNWKTQLHGACGFNEAGMGLTGTESIFASEAALAVDPYVKETGITEDDIADVLLCRCRTAREGTAELGRIIEAQGCGEGFGVAFVDETEVWYLETGSGHHWLAQRIPADTYFASGNQGRFQTYDPASDDQMASKNLVEFAVEKGLYNPETDGEFNFPRLIRVTTTATALITTRVSGSCRSASIRRLNRTLTPAAASPCSSRLSARAPLRMPRR